MECKKSHHTHNKKDVITIGKPEASVETYFKETIKASGGLPLKFKSESTNAVPDQIVLFRGKTYYAELKAPGEEPRPDQIALHKKFKSYGVTVHVCDTKDAVDDFITNVLKTKIKHKKSSKQEQLTIKTNQFLI